MKKIKINEKYFKVFFVLFIFILCLSWAISQPFDAGPDENMKYDVCKFIVNNGTLPHGGDETIRNPIWGISYAFQPIFSYIIGAIFMKIVMTIFSLGTLDFATVVAARLVSVLCNTGTAIFTIKIGEKLFKNKYTKWMFISLVTLLPQFVFIGSYINNDSLAIFAISIIIYSWIVGMESNWGKKSCIMLAVGIGICAISYYNAYVYILCSILLFATSFFKNKKIEFKYLFIKGIGISCIVLGICGWYFVRNIIVYDGDILGLKTENAYAEEFADNDHKPSTLMYPQRAGVSLIKMIFEMGWLKDTFKSFIAIFGYMSMLAPFFVYTFYEILILIGGIGCIISFKRIFANENKNIRKLNYFFMLGIVITVCLSLIYSYTSDYQPQGRYIMTSLIPFMYFLTLGIERVIDFIKKDIVKNIIKITISIICALLPIICLVILIIPYYSKL